MKYLNLFIVLLILVVSVPAEGPGDIVILGVISTIPFRDSVSVKASWSRSVRKLRVCRRR